MNDRQKALLSYLHTIAPHVRGAKTVNEFKDKFLKCIAEDLTFTASGFAEAFVDRTSRAFEKWAAARISELGKKAGAAFSDMRKR